MKSICLVNASNWTRIFYMQLLKFVQIMQTNQKYILKKTAHHKRNENKRNKIWMKNVIKHNELTPILARLWLLLWYNHSKNAYAN